MIEVEKQPKLQKLLAYSGAQAQPLKLGLGSGSKFWGVPLLPQKKHQKKFSCVQFLSFSWVTVFSSSVMKLKIPLI